MIVEATRKAYIRLRQAEIDKEMSRKQPNTHLIAVLNLHIKMAKDDHFTEKFGYVSGDEHGTFAKAYFLGY